MAKMEIVRQGDATKVTLGQLKEGEVFFRKGFTHPYVTLVSHPVNKSRRVVNLDNWYEVDLYNDEPVFPAKSARLVIE